jgi:hypothetical protein
LRPVLLESLYLKYSLSPLSGIPRGREFGVRSGNMKETRETPGEYETENETEGKKRKRAKKKM